MSATDPGLTCTINVESIPFADGRPPTTFMPKSSYFKFDDLFKIKCPINRR